MKIAERLFLLFMSIFAVVIIKECGKLPAGSEYTIGPGFLPRYISYAMILISLILLVQSFIKDKTEDKDFINKVGFTRLVSFFILLLSASIAINFVGMVIPLGVLMIIVFKFIEKYDWFSSLKVSILTIAIFYFIFKIWLKVPIPGFNF